MRPNIFRHLTSTLCLSSRSFHGGNVCRNVMKNFYGWESVAKEGDALKLSRLPSEKKNEWEPFLSRAIRSFKITFSFSPPTRRRGNALHKNYDEWDYPPWATLWEMLLNKSEFTIEHGKFYWKGRREAREMSFLMLQINQSLEKGNRNERKMMTYISLLVINNIRLLHAPTCSWNLGHTRPRSHVSIDICEGWFESDGSW